MDPAQRTYLATQILSEQATVSYRSVARAFRVHVNAAKRMLYEFHTHENGKKPGSIYATYLLAGLKMPAPKPDLKNSHVNGDAEDDEPMPSSPPPFTSSMLQSSQRSDANSQSSSIVPVHSIELVREELLEATTEQYERITSIHIYSLSSQRLPDLQTLTNIGYNLFTISFKEDPLVHNKTYGVIHNSGVLRRSSRRPPIAEAAISPLNAAKDELMPSGPAVTTSNVPSQPLTKKEEPSRPSSVGSTTSAPGAKKLNLKRDASDIFKSFAKAKSKPKIERKDTDGSASAHSGVEDVKMDDEDEEGDSEEEAMFLDTGTRKTGKKRSSEESNGRKTKEDRTAKLKKMMDSDDEESEESRKEDANMHKDSAENPEEAEDEAVAWSDSDTERKAKKNDSSAAAETGAPPLEPKRRRGRRKVMKKRTMKDEEGYLVTKEEEVWESFSEDERVPQLKPKPPFTMKTSGQQKVAAGGAKGKGGNIMSFFGKK